jgi:hypothetical protein
MTVCGRAQKFVAVLRVFGCVAAPNCRSRPDLPLPLHSESFCYKTVCCSARSGLPGCRGRMQSIAFVMIW